jgi:AAA domain
MKFITAKELRSLNPDPVIWICKPWLALEAITELDGKAKTAGKTTFALAMCKAILNGEDFLGEKTMKSSIVYLTEESRSTFRSAVDRAGIGESENFHVLFWKETHALQNGFALGSVWEQSIAEAMDYAKSVGATVLIVDTFAQFARLTGDRENSAGHILEAVMPIQKARDAGLAVAIIRHERKEAGSVGDSGRGSSALSGAVDIVLRLQRPEGRQPANYRQLQSVSRYDDTPPELMILRNESDGCYELIGETKAIAVSEAVREMLAILPEKPEVALTLDQISEALSIPRTTLQSAISDLEAKGSIAKVGRGVKGDSLRYHLNSAETHRD